jgi:hypothetical protein
MRRAGAALAAVGLAALGAGCESTQDRSAHLRERAKHVVTASGLHVTRLNRDVHVRFAQVVRDGNRTAVVVAVRNASRRPQAGVPLAIDVRDAQGRSVFRNDAPGLQPSLTSVPALAPGGEMLWVDDQVFARSPARRVEAKLGAAPATRVSQLPRIQVRNVRLDHDVSGVFAAAVVDNRSDVLQRQLPVFAVARRSGRIVAAGRAIVPKLKPGRHAAIKVFFVGDPRGARLVLAPSPAALK